MTHPQLKLLAALALLATASIAHAAPTVYAASGATAAGIQVMVDSFRTALGPLNANVVGSFGSGRREINWDGVPNAVAAPNNLPANFFNSNSPRGAEFTTPGTGFQVSANAGVAPVEFGNIDPNYPAFFAPFSSQRLFTALGSNIVDVHFFVPGSATPGLTAGFGAVFTDVDLPDSTHIEYFDAIGQSLGSFAAPNFAGNKTLSILGVVFSEGPVVSRVRITSGNQVLAAGNTSTDLVVMDDFIYGEPVAHTVPEPATLPLLLAAGLAATLRRRARAGPV